LKLIIHDRKESEIKSILNNSEETTVISGNGKIKPCIGCFGCFIKTPGQCVIKDGYEKTGVLLTKCNQVIIISQCFYGGYSPSVKNIIDRIATSNFLPYFETRNGEMHHPKRNKIDFLFSVYFYKKVSDGEKETARKLVRANGINLSQKTTAVHFYDSFEKIKGI